MRTTVAICTWNRARLLDQTLAQMRHLRIPPGAEWELIVVNNNCTDDTDEVVRRHAGHLPVVLCHEARQGLSYGRNHALARARGDYVLWTDDDVLVDPGWVEEILRTFEERGAAVVCSKILLWWESAPPPWFSPLFHGIFGLLDYGPEVKQLTDPAETIHGANMAFRRDALLRLGGFSEELGVREEQGGGEDVEVFLRALKAGLKVFYTPHAPIHHFIPTARCTKRLYRHRAWGSSEHHYRMLRLENQEVPWLLGLPRYFLRQNLGYLAAYGRSLLLRRPSESFYYELKLIRLVGLLRQAFGKRGPRFPPRGRAPAATAPPAAAGQRL